jgi:hypothetical protein
MSTCAFALWPLFRGALTSPDDIRVVNSDRAVRDARTLIANRRKYAVGEPYLEPLALPPSLRIADLRYAKVHDDHVDLIVARNPDWVVGARIWSEPHRPHRDKPTH